MPKENALQKNIREAKFIGALIDNGGVIKDAYKATRPRVKDTTACSMGSQTLSKINIGEINTILDGFGCSKVVALSGLWERMQRDRTVAGYGRGVDIIAKIAGWYAPKDQLRDLIADGLDLVEIVKVRLRKSSDTKHIDKAIDIPSTSTDGVVKEDIGKA